MLLLAGYPEATYITGERIAILLGLITAASALATVFSCRSFISLTNRLGFKGIFKNRGYQNFFRHHSYYWWAFWLIFSLHMTSGLIHVLMIPAIPDPDKYLHGYSIWSGLSALAVVTAVVLSCRVMPGPLTVLFNKNPLANRAFKVFYQYHSYYWLVFIALIIAHYSFGFLHSGWWPR